MNFILKMPKKPKHKLNFAYTIMGCELVITAQEKHLEVKKATFMHLLAGCSLTIKKGRNKKQEEQRIEQKTSLCHYINPLNNPTFEVVHAILILPLEKDTDNWIILRGSCKGEQRYKVISIEATRLNRTTSKDTSCQCHSGGGKVVIALHPHNTGIRGHQEMMQGGKFKTKPTKRVGNFCTMNILTMVILSDFQVL